MNYINNRDGMVFIVLDSGQSFVTNPGFNSITIASGWVIVNQPNDTSDISFPGASDYTINDELFIALSSSSLVDKLTTVFTIPTAVAPIMATDAETQVGTNGTKAISPLKLSSWWSWIRGMAIALKMNAELAFYNTVDQTSNFERARMFWSGNVFNLGTDGGGTGVSRNIQLLGSAIVLNSGTIAIGNGFTSATVNAIHARIFNGSIATSGITSFAAVLGTVNQSGTAGYRGWMISPYEQAVGSGPKLLIDAGTNSVANGGGVHTTKFSVDNTGTIISSGDVRPAVDGGGNLGVNGFSWGSVRATSIYTEQIRSRTTAGINFQNGLGTLWANFNNTTGNFIVGGAVDAGYKLDVQGTARVSSSITATQYNLSALNTAPASATAAGTLGEVRVTAGFIYVCTATNTWVRAALATW